MIAEDIVCGDWYVAYTNSIQLPELNNYW